MTIPDNQLRTAFTNETEMAVLIDAIFTSMDNRMEQALESCGNLTRANFIARKLKRQSHAERLIFYIIIIR